MKKISLVSVLLAGMLLFSAQAFAVDEQVFNFWADEATYVNREWPSGNFNHLDQLRVRDARDIIQDVDGNFVTYDRLYSRTYLKFSDTDLAQLDGLDIISAALYMYETERKPNTSSNDDMNLNRVTSDWSAADVTWATRPSTTSAANRMAYSYFSESDTTPGWRAWTGSLATLVGWWVNDEKPNYGIMLENDKDLEFNEMNSIFAKSGDFRPYLNITATPEPFSVVLFGIGGGLLGIFGARRRRRR